MNLKIQVFNCKLPLFIIIVISSYSTLYGQTTWQSSIVKFATDGKLMYVADVNLNRVVDFSWAGYKNSNEPIPTITKIISTLNPVVGVDNTTAINSAITAAASVTPDANGFRGVVLLKKGNYQINGTINLNVSGVIVRGEGNDPAGTVLTAVGNTPNQRSVFVAGGGTSTQWKQVGSVKTNITSPFVQVGSNQFNVASSTGFAVGDEICIYHPSSAAWITAVGGGGVDTAAPWTAGQIDIMFNRTILAISGNTIGIDAPVMNHLDLSLTQSYIYKIDKTTTKAKIGVENLRIDIQNWTSYRDEAHAWEGLVMADIEDSWAKNVTALHFGQSGFQTFTANRITIDSCQALWPCATLSGSCRDNFQIDEWSSNILVSHCIADSARHSFEVSGTSKASGVVFLRCTATNATNPSEGHFHWPQGLLYDCFRDYGTMTDVVLGLYSRGSMGTNHGWAAAHSVAWNCDLRRTSSTYGDMICQQPPTAQNYMIGGFANVNRSGKIPFPQYPLGYVEGVNNTSALLNPQSLFEEQLKERLAKLTTVLNPLADHSDFKAFSTSNNATIEYNLEKETTVSVQVYGINGQLIKTIILNETQASGVHQKTFDIQHVCSGIYLIKLTTDGFSFTTKLIVSR
ncbi:MAG: T9SS type A sorting domain-containing protein [Paludibacter sp.]